MNRSNSPTTVKKNRVKTMNKKRESFWNADSLEKYSDRTEQLARKSVAEQNGEPIAENLENIWAGLSEDEQQLIEYLYLSERRTVVVLREDGVFSGLLSKGLLQTPPGVGSLFMQYLQTTYTIPIAVWKLLQKRPGLFFSHREENKARQLKQLTLHFKDQVDALVKDSSARADV
jgi:hypothetical protein